MFREQVLPLMVEAGSGTDGVVALQFSSPGVGAPPAARIPVSTGRGPRHSLTASGGSAHSRCQRGWSRRNRFDRGVVKNLPSGLKTEPLDQMFCLVSEDT